MPHPDTAAAELARRQHALITHRQALDAGLTAAQIRHRCRTGRWLRLHRGTYLIAGAPVTWETKVHAAVLAAGEEALASHRTAAVLWGLDGFRPGRVEISVPRHHRPEHLPVRLHESTDLDLARPVRRQGIPTTGLLRTVLDIGCLVRPELLESAVDEVVRDTSHEWPDLYETLLLHSRRGRNGCGPFRAILDERYGDDIVTDSHFERMVRSLVIDAGLPVPESQHPILDLGGRFVAEVDLAWPDQLVAVELQSKRFHLNHVAFERDKQRLNAARLLGWNILEYTWAFFRTRPEVLLGQLALALRQAHRPAAG